MNTVIVYRSNLSEGQTLEANVWEENGELMARTKKEGMTVRKVVREFVPSGWSPTSIFSELVVEFYNQRLAPIKAQVLALGYKIEEAGDEYNPYNFFYAVGRDIPAGKEKRIHDLDDVTALKPLAPEFPAQEFQVKIRMATAIRSPSGRGMAVGTGTTTVVPVSAWRTEHGLIAVSSSETGWTARRAEAAVALRLLRRKGITRKMLSLSLRTERLIEFPVKNWRKAREAREAAIAAFDTAKAADEIRYWQRGMAEEFGGFASLHTVPGGMDMGPVGPQAFNAMTRAAHAACAAAERR